MNPLRKLFVCLLAAGLIPVCASAAETPEQMIAAAKALDAAFFKAFSAGDVEGVAATYWHSPDVVSFPPDAMEVRGWDAIKQAYVDAFKTMAGAKLEAFDVHYMVAGEFVFTWGKWRMTMPGPDGKPTSMEGRYSDLKGKRDGKWVFIQDHGSVPMAPPPVG